MSNALFISPHRPEKRKGFNTHRVHKGNIFLGWVQVPNGKDQAKN